LKIQFICSDPAVKEYFDIKPANKSVPQWYKDLPTRDQYDRSQIPTIKECMPAQDMIMSGYIIFNTYEFTLFPQPSKGIETFEPLSHNPSHIGEHLYEQCPVKIRENRKNYFKISNPWLIRTPPGYSCLIMQPFYEFESRFQLMPAIVDTDVHDLPIELPGYLLTSDPVNVESGTPIAQIIPFKRDEWVMETLTQPHKTSKLQFMFGSAYRKVFHNKKIFR
jgi:hypothetical protein